VRTPPIPPPLYRSTPPLCQPGRSIKQQQLQGPQQKPQPLVCADGAAPPCSPRPSPTRASPPPTSAARAPALAPALAPTCKAAATADLDARAAQPGFQMARAKSSWGPDAATFPAASAPPGCDAAAWARLRLQGAVDRMVALGFCYCHHHAPWWMPPPNKESTCVADCVGRRQMPNQGVDCRWGWG